MNAWLSWVVPLIGVILIATIPAIAKGYSLLALLIERVKSNSDAIAAEREARMSADAEQCRRLIAVEDNLDDLGKMCGRIDERTGMMLSGLQRAGVVDNTPLHR